MDIGIFEKATGKQVYMVPVELGGMNYQPSMDEAYNIAWKCAVDDKAVKADQRDKYNFAVVGS